MTESQTSPPIHTESKVKSLSKVESESFQTYYANSIDILMSVYDFIITIGQMRASGPDSVVIEQQARVIMSPQHVKILAKLLAQKVVQYEATFGVIPGDSLVLAPASEHSPDAAPKSA